MAFLSNAFDFMNADVNLRDGIARNDAPAVLLALERGAEINNSHTGVPYILMASRKEFWPMVRLLGEKGSKLDGADRSGWTLAHDMAIRAPHEEFAWLVKEGASLLRADHKGERPVHAAAKAGRWDNVSLLLDYEDDSLPASSDKAGMTVMHYACIQGREDMIERLGKMGISMSAPNKDGRSPWDLLPSDDLRRKYDPSGDIAKSMESYRKDRQSLEQEETAVVAQEEAPLQPAQPEPSRPGSLTSIRRR